MACTVGDIARILEAWAPAASAEAGDNTGLLVGLSARTVDTVLIALDVDESVIGHAGSMGAQMIVAHHPFLYRPLLAVSDATRAGRLAILAIEAGIAVFAAHTNLDRAPGGVNDALCGAVGLRNVTQAAEGSIGRLANTCEAMTLDGFARLVKTAICAPAVRVTGPGDRPVGRVYVVSGAGRHDIADAAGSGADCMLTGEIDYHSGQDALACGLAVVEAGHYHTEKPVLYNLEKHLQSQFQLLQYRVRTKVYEPSTCPFHYIG
jgi:dinuclear metal center YbgI/SA1388 family protein